ncbi:Fe(2+) transport protein 1 [Quillaja saponaria]|uniref:Fe(2+) transport protein 1 n=1 Tax=Quillaja saponaria TaxID=32244 RepID=A0AAD7KNT2_QUISA|nr:Fe(2+) transport protein 1 [Quillaja saponaria]
MASNNKLISLISIFLLLLSMQAFANQEMESTSSSQCGTKSLGGCHDKAKALKFKIIAINSILVASMIGVCLPLFSRAVPALQPDRNLFVLVKTFASGVILATGYMHVLPDSFDCLSGHVATEDGKDSQLLRNRVVAQVLEFGIVVHSVVIGLSMGASDNPCTIRPLIAALCFHQLFEGMGLGGCILQAEYERKMKAILVFFFSVTTPFGIALGIGLSNVYSEDSPTALIVVGILDAASAGLLNYMALVDLLAADFMGSKLQRSTKLQIGSYMAVLLGAGGMSLMAIWAYLLLVLQQYHRLRMPS